MWGQERLLWSLRGSLSELVSTSTVLLEVAGQEIWDVILTSQETRGRGSFWRDLPGWVEEASPSSGQGLSQDHEK